MRVYRIGRSEYIRDITGTGAKLFGGRWNRKGISMLYTAEHRSLAALEVLVHLNTSEVPDDLKIISIEIPSNSIITIGLERFKKIQKRETKETFQVIGNKWVLEEKSLCLKVPSIVINEEFNVLLNPNHKLFKKVKIDKVDDFIFDKRLFK